MRHNRSLAIAALTAAIALAGAGSAGASHDQPQRAEAADAPVATSRPPPVKRQNFRARRADEIPPWEGFEDCPLGLPCVGITVPHPHPRRR